MLPVKQGYHIQPDFINIFSIPRSIGVPILRNIESWVEFNGEEWTVNRLKAIKLDFIRLKAGLPIVSQWVAVDRKKGLFKGHYGGLQKWASLNYKRWSKCICFLQAYTSFIADSVTKSQEKKFLDGVLSTPVDIPEEMTQAVIMAASTVIGCQPIVNVPQPLVTVIPSSSRREPHASGSSYPEGTMTLECCASFMHSTMNGHYLRKKYKSIFSHVLHGIKSVDSRDTDYASTVVADYYPSIGKIGLIQEPGYKLRAVANPARVYQQALKPLGDKLYSILKTLPWDCTFNQSLPFEIIREHLCSGNTAYSIDLSGATDYFPLELQMSVLRTLFPGSPYVDLFHDLSRSKWIYGSGRKQRVIAWTKGQPLGLYPSFASFALTHGLLLYALNGGRHDNKFFVLGDDVIILDVDLNVRYRSALDVLECPVSESKSLTSKYLAEFGGKIITPYGVIHQFKWRTVSDDSFIDFVKNFGSKAESLLQNRQRNVINFLKPIPDFMGGLGCNPGGVPLQERINMYWDFAYRDDNQSYIMGYNRAINRMNYYGKGPYSYRDVSIDPGNLDFDQKSFNYVLKYLPNLVNWYEILGYNLYSVVDELPLPLEAGNRRKTTLESKEYSIKSFREQCSL